MIERSQMARREEGLASGSRISSLPIVSAWVGGELSYLEKLCLTSMVSAGHETILYCYRETPGVPNGVEIRDAAQIMPEEQFSQHENGSYALGSDFFRYKLFASFPCIWVDMDMLLLHPITQQEDYILGWEDETSINNAVLSIPAESQMLRELVSLISKTPFFAPWWDEAQRRHQEEAVQREAGLALSDLPWATTGPRLVTYLAIKHGVAGFALPSDVFYPVHWQDYRIPFEPGDPVSAKLTERTIGVHFWNHMLGDLKENPAVDSFVAGQCRRHGIPLPGAGGGDGDARTAI
ncbi:MAG: hypothetical protein QOJ94_1938 [Sphingomonadales bacterium]|jgi:hypothetical protein|nr:hypothetical protein [Sphingomonadales bacterium]